MERDFHSHCKVLRCWSPVSTAVAIVGEEIDTVGYESLEFLIACGALGAGTSLVIMEDSPDDGAGSPTGVWTKVAADLILGGNGVVGELGTIIATDNDAVFRAGYIGKEQHVRLTLPETTDFTTYVIGAVALLTNPKSAPQDDQAP